MFQTKFKFVSRKLFKFIWTIHFFFDKIYTWFSIKWNKSAVDHFRTDLATKNLPTGRQAQRNTKNTKKYNKYLCVLCARPNGSSGRANFVFVVTFFQTEPLPINHSHIVQSSRNLLTCIKNLPLLKKWKFLSALFL